MAPGLLCVWPALISVPGARVLLFNHIPKCGGTTVRTLLPQLLQPRSFVVRTEQQASYRKNWGRAYVISTMRDPCSYYVSLFGFASAGRGSFRNGLMRMERPIMQQILRRDEHELDRFGRFLEVVAGCLTMRTFFSLPDLSVDCWLRTSDLLEDFADCLADYEAHGGRTKKGWRGILRNITNATGAHDNQSKHRACSKYYTPENVAIVEQSDKSVCELLGGCHCCEPLPKGAVDHQAVKRFNLSMVPLSVPAEACWTARWTNPQLLQPQLARWQVEGRARSGRGTPAAPAPLGVAGQEQVGPQLDSRSAR